MSQPTRVTQYVLEAVLHEDLPPVNSRASTVAIEILLDHATPEARTSGVAAEVLQQRTTPVARTSGVSIEALRRSTKTLTSAVNAEILRRAEKYRLFCFDTQNGGWDELSGGGISLLSAPASAITTTGEDMAVLMVGAKKGEVQRVFDYEDTQLSPYLWTYKTSERLFDGWVRITQIQGYAEGEVFLTVLDEREEIQVPVLRMTLTGWFKINFPVRALYSPCFEISAKTAGAILHDMTISYEERAK